MNTIFKPALIYGLLCFCTGFVFGALREIFLIPAFGRTGGHWLEFIPLILIITLIGIWITRYWPLRDISHSLIIGIIAVGILLVLESTFALWLMDMPLSEYLDSFNFFNGQLFPIGLFIMMMIPAISVHFQK